MKKRNLKGLSLNKKTVSNLKEVQAVKGGASDSPTRCQACPGGPVDIPSFDFPTINDSCFSWCDDKCNDY